VSAPSCTQDQTPFVIQINPGSYVDLVFDDQNCGLIPSLCLSDFDKHGVEKSVDNFYRRLLSLAQGSKSDVRVLPALNLVDASIRYFHISNNLTPDGLPQGRWSGCAVENDTRNLTIYNVKSITSEK
jgi:hypothetical protein